MRLNEVGLRDLRAVEVTRDIGVAPATFYQYFPDVEAAVLALARKAGEDMRSVTFELNRNWSGAEGLEAARSFVSGFLEYWDAHRAVLRTRNLAAQEGDERFRSIRHESLRPLLDGMAELISRGRSIGSVSEGLEPSIAAAALLSMLERIAAFHRDLATGGISDDAVIETVARILHQAITGEVAR